METFILSSSVTAFILVNLLKKFIKKFISPRWGDFGVQLFLLAVALTLSLFGYVWGKLPADITGAIAGIFAGAMVIYQVLYKAIFKKVISGKLDVDEK